MRSAAAEDDRPKLITHNLAFHRYILDASENTSLAKCWASLGVEALLTLTIYRDLMSPADVAESHVPIVDLLRARRSGRGRARGAQARPDPRQARARRKAGSLSTSVEPASASAAAARDGARVLRSPRRTVPGGARAAAADHRGGAADPEHPARARHDACDRRAARDDPGALHGDLRPARGIPRGARRDAPGDDPRARPDRARRHRAGAFAERLDGRAADDPRRRRHGDRQRDRADRRAGADAAATRARNGRVHDRHPGRLDHGRAARSAARRDPRRLERRADRVLGGGLRPRSDVVPTDARRSAARPHLGPPAAAVPLAHRLAARAHVRADGIRVLRARRRGWRTPTSSEAGATPRPGCCWRC